MAAHGRDADGADIVFRPSWPVSDLTPKLLSKVWLWTASAALVTVFMIRASRGKHVALDLLGKVCGVLVTDRWCAYSWWPLNLRQLCWSHIKRHFKKMKEAGGEAGEIGEQLDALRKRLFALWHRVRDGTLERSSFQTYASAITGGSQSMRWSAGVS